jgi:di/tricarboxylate transporter
MPACQRRCGALALFVWNRLRVDVVGLIVMATLILTGLVTPREGISGFANEALITVAAMFILSAGLLRTGAIDMLGRWTERGWRVASSGCWSCRCCW